MTYYDEIADGYDELHGEEQQEKLALMRPFIPEDMTILDIGCGTGISAGLGRVIGLDPSQELLKKAPIPVVRGKAEALPFKDGSFSCVISLTALHHVTDIPKTIREIRRVAKGRVIVSLLKRAAAFSELHEGLSQTFKVEKEIDEGTDLILVCAKEQDL